MQEIDITKAINYTNLGAHRQESDPRDFQIGSVQPPVALPASYMPKEFFGLTALMQGRTPACGGFSLTQLVQYYNYLRTGNAISLSPRFAYMAEKALDGVGINVEGTTLRGIGQAITTMGSCLDSLVTDDTTLASPIYGDIAQASAAAKSDALTRKELSYFYLNDLSLNGIMQAIYQNKAVILELQVGAEWWTDAVSGQVSWDEKALLPLRTPNPKVSAHYMVFGAFEPDAHPAFTRIWGINSWSPKWAQNGFGYFRNEYLPYVVGGIAIVDITPEVKQEIKQQAAVIPSAPVTPKPLTPAQISLVQQILAKISQVVSLISQKYFPKN